MLKLLCQVPKFSSIITNFQSDLKMSGDVQHRPRRSKKKNCEQEKLVRMASTVIEEKGAKNDQNAATSSSSNCRRIFVSVVVLSIFILTCYLVAQDYHFSRDVLLSKFKELPDNLTKMLKETLYNLQDRITDFFRTAQAIFLSFNDISSSTDSSLNDVQEESINAETQIEPPPTIAHEKDIPSGF